LNDDNGSQSQEDGTVISLVYGVPGVVMMAGGGVTYMISKAGARAFEGGGSPVLSRPPPERSPPALPPPWPPPTPPAAAPTKPAPPPADEPQVVPAPAESPR